jgi:hypothetical protein
LTRRVTAARWCSAVLLASLAGCGGSEKAQRPPAQQRLPPPPAGAPIEDLASRRDRFCRALAQIVDAESAGFAPLRGPDAGESLWDGVVVPPELRACTIDGDSYPGASYVCRGEAIAGGSGNLLGAEYVALAAEVDDCLQRPIWYPRSWRQGQDFVFAGGERQMIWRDGSTGPKPTVALKIEEDIGQGLFFLRLAVASDH